MNAALRLVTAPNLALLLAFSIATFLKRRATRRGRVAARGGFKGAMLSALRGLGLFLVLVAFLAGPGLTADVRPALKTALDALGGRGGGRPDRAQGAAEADEEQARAALKAAAEKLLT